MIAMSSSARSFGALAQYLAKGRTGDEPERVAWSASRNLPTDDPELAGKNMRATAAQNVRVKQPVYHLALSFDPGDQVNRIAMERVADRVIAALELQGHQILIVSHRDRGHPHMHLLVNRVHPETGLVWNRWQDRAVIQQVLREQEEALGLRIVPGRLAVREQPTLDVITESQRSGAPEEKAAEPTVERERASDDAPAKITKVDEVAGHLRTHERATELVREQYTAEMEASAARARAQQLEEAVHRAETARGAFDRALSAVYRDPAEAPERFTVAVEQKGLTEATRTMRERPEDYGELVAVEKPRAFGLGRTLDDTAARNAAVGAAINGRDAIEADQSAQQIGLGVRARRLETAWSRELGELFEDPTAARAAFERQAREHGPSQAVKAVRERPDELGKVRADLRAAPLQVTAKAERVAVIGREVIGAGQTSPGGRPTPGFRIDLERTASRADAERAGARSVRVSTPGSTRDGIDAFETLGDALVSTGGLRDLTLAAATPWGGKVRRLPLWGGWAGASEPTARVVDVTLVDDRYMSVTGALLLRGRDISAGDRPGAPLVALMNEPAARLLRAGEEATADLWQSSRAGRHIRVIGTVRDGEAARSNGDETPRLYLPLGQFTELVTEVEILARVPGEPRSAATRLRSELSRLGTDRLEIPPTPIAAIMRDRTAGLRSGLTLLLVASAGTLFLAALGIYAQVHAAVRARTREIGIRMAVGAQPARLMRLMLRDSCGAIALGLLLGGWSVDWLKLYILPNASQSIITTPQTWAAASLSVICVFALSVIGPTRRALRIDPVSSLRGDLG